MQNRRPDTLISLAALVLISLLGFRMALGPDRFLDNDELVHLNGAYFISQGETIYGSFFENHPPLLAWALQPIVRSTDSPETMISRARILILIFQLGIWFWLRSSVDDSRGGLPRSSYPACYSHRAFSTRRHLKSARTSPDCSSSCSR